MLDTLRKEIWAVDRNVALTMTGSLEDYLKRFTYAEPRFSLILLGIFAGIGVVLVALCVYSLIAYTVSRQSTEMRIRMSSGDSRHTRHPAREPSRTAPPPRAVASTCVQAR